MKNNLRKIVGLISCTSLIGLSTQAVASGFQIWEQDGGASIGNYHAGYAALANDATIAFYNPAGITRFKNQQLVFGAAAILSDITYRGTVATDTFMGGVPQGVTAQGGGFNLVPDFHYVAPITEQIGFGFSVVVPFGFKTSYGNSTPLRYAATLSQAQVIDISPDFALKLSKKFSFGAGFDIQKMNAEFDMVGTNGPGTDTTSVNKGSDTAYGFHLGALYEFNQNSRIGLSYHSKVVHHLLDGTSEFTGPLSGPDFFDPGVSSTSNNTRSNITLPPYTALSAYHHFDQSKWAVMATAIFTQWNVLKTLALQNVVGVINVNGGMSGTSGLTVSIPQFYRNTWNVSVGTDYYLTDIVTLRGGIGFDQSPTRDAYRNVQAPDNDRYAIAFGGHYQATKALGVDLGWTHLFIRDSSINPPGQVTGAQETFTNGNVVSSADVFGAQLTWDIA